MIGPSPYFLPRRRMIGGLAASAAIALASPPLGAQPAAATRRSVLLDIPEALHAAIASGSVAADLVRYIDRAARLAVAEGRALHFPAGTYTMHTWAPPAGLTVSTDGRATVFKQLDTRGRPQRFIEVGADGVRLWPGGAATIDGGMTARGTNATAFNSGIRIHARRGARITRFECGDVFGRNLGGDVVETGCERGGLLGTCVIGAVHGDNVYRNVLSITSGERGSVAAVIQEGGCGLMALDIEPDPTSVPVGTWTIGVVRGHRATVAGDPLAGIGSVTIGELDLDNARPSSRPAFRAGGVSRATHSTLFDVGLRYRNVGALRIERAAIANFPRAAIEDLGSTPRDPGSGAIAFGSLVVRNCGDATGYQIVTQRTRTLTIERLTATEKRAASIATFLGGTAPTATRVGQGEIAGRAVLEMPGSFEVGALTVRGPSDYLFRGVRGRLALSRLRSAGAAVVFDGVTGPIEVADSDIQAAQLARGSSSPRLRASRINGRQIN